MPHSKDLTDYLSGGYRQVQGWFGRVDCEIFRALLLAQNQNNLGGAVAEIGVHHGKSFIALCLALSAGEKGYCIDVFDAQHLNKDRSGSGNRADFERNLGRFGVPLDRIVIDARSSEDVHAQDITKAVGPVRFFSIDGGHWATIVVNDFRLAEATLAEHGVIALDDFHRPEWPEVSLGYFSWFKDRKVPLVPFAVGYNKLYLCGENWAESYKNLLVSDPYLRWFLQKIVTLQDVQVPVFQEFSLPEFSKAHTLLTNIKVFYPDLYVRIARLRAQARERFGKR